MWVARLQTDNVDIAPIDAHHAATHLSKSRSQMPDSAADIEYSLARQPQPHRRKIRNACLVHGNGIRRIEHFHSSVPAYAFALVVASANVDRVGKLLGPRGCRSALQ